MRITRRPPGQTPTVSDATPTTPLGGGSVRSESTDGSRDSVELSSTARLLQRLRGEIGDLDIVATAQVRELQQRVDANQYHPAPRAVAERLLSELAIDALS